MDKPDGFAFFFCVFLNKLGKAIKFLTIKKKKSEARFCLDFPQFSIVGVFSFTFFKAIASLYQVQLISVYNSKSIKMHFFLFKK